MLESMQLAWRTTDGDVASVTVTSGDRIAVNRAIRAEGQQVSDLTVLEYTHRLAFQTGTRTGVIAADADFDEWSFTVGAFTDDPAELEGANHPEA